MDDIAENVDVLARHLESGGYRVYAASDGLSAIRVAQRVRPDLVLLDVNMPGIDGYETCRRLRHEVLDPETPVVFVTARDDAASVSAGFSAGAVDFVSKPFFAEEVLHRVETHLRTSRLNRQLKDRNAQLVARATELEALNQSLQAEVRRRQEVEAALDVADQKLSLATDREAQRWGLGSFVGQSRCVRDIVENVRRLQNFSSVNVLITGESGTGKELVARALHLGGARSAGPFIAVNCVTIPGELAESMLFGHIKGAFTGATADRKGYFELAHGGTLFLDEIGDMPVNLQAKLLRVLQDGRVLPVGASREKQVDVRVVAATNADLATQIETGAFRRDLYFRLAQYTVHVPPLRERSEDVRLLARHFLSVFAGEMGMNPPAVTEGAYRVLEGYEFPGNIRELKNIIERALIESGGEPIEERHLRLLTPAPAARAGRKEGLKEGAKEGGKPAAGVGRERAEVSGAARDGVDPQSVPLNLEEAEEYLIRRALAETGGNVAEAARKLGVNRSRIYRRMGGATKEA